MHKLVILFGIPIDLVGFESRWSEEFLPLAEQMPGVKRIAVSRTRGGPSGEAELHLIHEFFFDDLESLQAAMASPAGQEAGRALMTFDDPSVSILFAEHLEESRDG